MEVIKETLMGYAPVLLQIVGSVLGVVAVQTALQVKNWVVAKVGQTTYNRAVEVAKGLYVLFEDEFKEFEKAGEDKKKKMKQVLLQQFPTLTETELDAINKMVWESFNKEYTAGWGVLEGIDTTTEGEAEEDLNE